MRAFRPAGSRRAGRFLRSWLPTVVAAGLLLAGHAGADPESQPETTVQPRRLALLGASGAVAHWAGFAYFDRAWYQGEKRDSIRWLHDWSGETYVHLDKGGHFLGGMYLSQGLGSAFRWTGFGPRAAAGFGAATSFALMFEIEMRDAYYADWGFSIPDFLANTAGAAVPLAHELWPQTRLVGFKFSWWPSSLYLDHEARAAAGRPHTQHAIDDYEGMTFWMTFAVEPLLPDRWQDRWPDWLGLGLGYAAGGMHGANVKSRGPNRDYPDLPSARPEVLLSLDADLRHLPGDAWWWKELKAQANWLRLPAPAIRLYPDVRFYLLYL
jgi:hypothetical protein